MKKLRVWWVIGCIVLGGLWSLTGCARKEKEAAAKQSTPLASLGEDVITLEEAVFYTRMLQESWEHTYYEHYGQDMWQEDLGEEAGTLSQLLKRDVLDALTEIHLLCVHAKEYGVELTKEEQEVIAGRAEAFMESNTPGVLEAAGATVATVEAFLQRNELAAKVAEAMKTDCEPKIDKDAARVGKLTYALFATTGTFDAEGNCTPFTEEELEQVRTDAESFVIRAQELGSVAEAGAEISHTVLDVYYNEESDGGAHPLVAQAARQLKAGQVSDMIETAEGYYIVQCVSEYDEAATLENLELHEENERLKYYGEVLEAWRQETPPEVDEALWETVQVEEMLTDPALLSK